jgi:hypothetical protein
VRIEREREREREQFEFLKEKKYIWTELAIGTDLSDHVTVDAKVHTHAQAASDIATANALVKFQT